MYEIINAQDHPAISPQNTTKAKLKAATPKHRESGLALPIFQAVTDARGFSKLIFFISYDKVSHYNSTEVGEA
jgi:hypothetical protein